MRVSIWIGLVTLALGIGFSTLADALIQTRTITATQTFASTFAAVLFVLFSATLLGTGAALVIHWIIGFARHSTAFIAELVLSFATLFMGIGAALMTDNWWTAGQLFFTFLTASTALFAFSIASLFGGFLDGLKEIKRHIKKAYR